MYCLQRPLINYHKPYPLFSIFLYDGTAEKDNFLEFADDDDIILENILTAILLFDG